MNTLSLRVRYRPIRLGFCVERGNKDDLRKALQLAHTLWGGRFNPVIPVGTTTQDGELTTSLVDAFRVDALYPVRDAAILAAFVGSFPYLMWPDFERALFTQGMRGTVAQFLDIYHPARTIFEEHVKDKTQPRVSSILYEWDEEDPLGDVFLAFLGRYPSATEIAEDYADLVLKNLRGERVHLDPKNAIPADVYKKLTPSALSAWGLERETRSFRHQPGFYAGVASDFDDIVNFWNLRAAGIDLVFYDRAFKERLGDLKAAYLEALGKRPSDPNGWLDRVAVWAKTREALNVDDFGQNGIGAVVGNAAWNGLNVVPSGLYIDESSVLASVDENRTNTPSVSFQFQRSPFSPKQDGITKRWSFLSPRT